MGVERQFIGWDEPTLHAVARRLLSDAGPGPRDLSDTLVVVPTRQAGRRLRETLAATCARDDTGLLAPRVVTPSWLGLGSDKPAPSLLVSTVWTHLLLHLDLAHYPSLFPSEPPARDVVWALETGAMLQDLREALAEGGLRCRDVPDRAGDRLPEPQRWRELAHLEDRFLVEADRLGFRDPCRQMLEACADPVLPDGVSRVVVAATPDPPPIVVQAWERLAETVDVFVLVPAPEALRDRFDRWGRPIPEAWIDAEIPIPEPATALVLGGSPAGQVSRVVAALRALPDSHGPADLAVGVPDRTVIPTLTGELRRLGLAGYDPAGRPLAEYPVYRLLDAWAQLVRDRAYEGFSAWLRHPDVLQWLSIGHGVAPATLLTELDRFQNRHLPVSIDDVQHQLSGYSDDRFPVLRATWGAVRGLLETAAAAPVRESVAGLLQEIYRVRTVRADEPADRRFMAAAAQVREGLDELERCGLDRLDLPDAQHLPLLLRALRDRLVYPEREPGAIDLEGWLELPWNDAPFLVVTGMNEGAVPDSRIADPFLPDRLRESLGLRPDIHRLARDAFLMRGLIESRRASGSTRFIVGKTGPLGDPLKPSRLLFHCADEDLPERAAALFSEADEPRVNLPATVSFPLGPPAPPGPVTTLHVTSFSTYLACPFRFYLSRVLDMAPLDDTKPELDALDFGNLVHDALERMARHPEIAASTDADAIAEFLCGAATRWVHGRIGSHLPLQVALQLHAARQRLVAAARVQAGWVAEGWRIEQAEYRIDTAFHGLRIVGKIDRIDRHQATGEMRVIDYKSSDKADPPEKAHLGTLCASTRPYAAATVKKKQKAWTNLQLPLYRILLDQAGIEGMPVLGYFNLPKALQDTGFAWWDAFDDDLLASARTCAGGVIDDIRDGRFWPPGPVDPRYDDFANLFHGTPEELFIAP